MHDNDHDPMTEDDEFPPSHIWPPCDTTNCRLELILLSARDTCGRCHRPAKDHAHWAGHSREDASKETEDDDDIELDITVIDAVHETANERLLRIADGLKTYAIELAEILEV